jgi:hypothetical protein
MADAAPAGDTPAPAACLSSGLLLAQKAKTRTRAESSNNISGQRCGLYAEFCTLVGLKIACVISVEHWLNYNGCSKDEGKIEFGTNNVIS